MKSFLSLALDELGELRAQRDEFLAVCKLIATDLERYREEPEYETRIGDRLRAAIARAEAKP